jgi:hypothetical protein
VRASATVQPITGMLAMDVEPDRASFPPPSQIYGQYIATAHSTIIEIG